MWIIFCFLIIKYTIMKRLYLFIYMWLLCSIIAIAQTPTLKADSNGKNFVYPGELTYYILETGNSKVSRVDWSVSGGSFHPSESKTSIIGGDKNGINVYWSNVKSYNNSTPTGTLTAKVYYVDYTIGDKETKYKQNIYSLNGAQPPSLKSDNLNLDFGVNKFDVSISNIFYFPGINDFNDKIYVQSYEWTLPNGWSCGGETGTFINNSSSITVTTDNFNSGEIKVRGINHKAEYDKSDYSSLKFSRKFNYTKYPESIPFGKSGTYIFETQLLDGITYEWVVPSGWKIDNGGNTKEGLELNTINVTTGICPSDGIVKVRLKDGKETTDWYLCPYKGVSDPNITSNANYQFEYSSLQLDLSSSVSGNIKWIGEGMQVISGQGTNNPKIIFTKSGNVTIQAEISLSGCTEKKTITKTFSVSPCRYTISGENTLCSNNSIYRIGIENIPSEVNLKWTSSQNKIEILDGQGTNTITVGILQGMIGDDSIILTASLGGESYSVSKKIYVGYPSVSKISGPSNLRVNVGGSFVAEPVFDRDVCKYQWIITPSSGVTQSSSYNTNYITFSNSGSYSVACRAYTEQCGAPGSAATMTVSVQSSYLVYYKDSERTINITERVSNINSISNNDTETIDYKLYNQATGILSTEGKLYKSGGTIHLNSLSPGIYVLRLDISSNIFETHKIILK